MSRRTWTAPPCRGLLNPGGSHLNLQSFFAVDVIHRGCKCRFAGRKQHVEGLADVSQDRISSASGVAALFRQREAAHVQIPVNDELVCLLREITVNAQSDIKVLDLFLSRSDRHPSANSD